MNRRLSNFIGSDTRTAKTVRHPAVLASLISMLFTGTAGWQIAKRVLTPWVVGVVQTAVAADTEKKINTKLIPVLSALKSNKESAVAEMEDDFKLETLRKQQVGSKWTNYDELKLTQLERRLKDERKKLDELTKQAADAMAGATQ